MSCNVSVTTNANLLNSITKKGIQRVNKRISITNNDLLTCYTPKAISLCWNAFCSVIAQNYNLGKGTIIKGFGIFTFNNFEVNLIGTTNQFSRDNKERTPVFIVSSEFLESLRPGQYAKSGLIYYNQKLNNGISHITINFAEIAYSNSIPKDECVFIINNLIKHIRESILKGTFINKDLPGIGVLLLRNNIIGVKFDENLISESRNRPQKLNVFKRNIKIGMDLSSARNTCSGEIINPYEKAEELRTNNSVITRLTRNGDLFLNKAYNIDINTLPIHERHELFSGKMFKSQNGGEIKFINDQSKLKKIYLNGKKLAELEINKEILKSLEFFKGVIIAKMKKHDKKINGKINVQNCIEILSSSNIHDDLDTNLAKAILYIYSNGLDEIDYMQFIACLIKDSQAILSKSKSNLALNSNVIMKTSREHKNSKSFTSLPELANLSCKNATSRKQFGNNDLTKYNLRSINEQKKMIDLIKKQLISLKILIPQLKVTNKTRLDQNISVSEFMNLLSNFSISYSEETIRKILLFIQINNLESFTINEFESQLNKITVLDKIINEDDLECVFKKAKDIFYLKGGKGSLFKDSNEITKDHFISLLSQDIPNEIAEGFYSYLVKTKRNFTIEDYNKYFEKDSSLSNEENKINLMRMLNRQMEKKHLRTEEYFDYLLTYNISTKQKSLSCADFIRALQSDKIPLSAEEISILFKYIDANEDNIIDREEFLSKVNYISSPLCEMQYSIRKKSLDIEDICHRMQLNNGTNIQLTIDDFSKRIKMLDYTFNTNFINGLFNALKDKSEESIVNSDTLLKALNVYSKIVSSNDEKNETVKIKSFTTHFKSMLKDTVSFSSLKRAFEEIDFPSNGLLSQVDFCTVLMKYLNKEFTDDEIIKFVRIRNLYDDSKVNIKYTDFLDLIYYDVSSDRFLFLCEQIKTIIDKDFNGSIEKMLMKINKKERIQPITAEKLKEFLKKKINEDIPLRIYCKFDIDADGLLSFEDLKCALGRYTKSSFFKYENKEESPEINLYPSETMNENKFKLLVKSLKKFIESQSLSEIGLFRKLDISNDGLISSLDFNNTIDSIFPMAPAIKDQFFNYLDYYHNGMIDLETFIFRLKDISGSSILPKNNNAIENMIIEEFSKFILKNTKLSETELFSLMDKDCDGIINHTNFKQFIIDNLLISPTGFNEYQIERVMQSISLTKNKMIGINDITEFKNKAKRNKTKDYHINLKEIFKITTNQSISLNRENNDWINEVIERFGMYISEKYSSIKEFFEKTTEKGQNKFTYADFLKFNSTNIECFNNGFNLTKDELLATYSSLDSQKKDYLLLEDFEVKLQLFDFYKKMHIDIKNFLKQNFNNAVDAFKFFLDPKGEYNQTECIEEQKKSVLKKYIFKTLEYFFPKKYATDTILKYLDKYFKSDIVSFSAFSYIYFDSIAFDELFLASKNKLTNSRNDLMKSHSQFKPKYDNMITPFDNDSLNKIKRLLESSRYDLKKYFDIAELQAENGIINKYQFRNLIKKLNLGLTSLEIDGIIARSGKMNHEGLINLNDFIKYLKGEDVNLHQAKDNVSSIIGNIKQLIYKYYNNPIVCFHSVSPIVIHFRMILIHQDALILIRLKEL